MTSNIGELASLKHKDIWLDEKCILLHGKGKRKRFVPCPQQLFFHIVEFANWKRSTCQSTNPDDYFMLSRLGKPYSINSLENMIKKLCVKCNVRYKSPHAFLHAFSNTYLDKTGRLNGGSGDLKGLQQLLGHSDLSVTTIYLQVPFEKLSQRVEGLYDN